MSDGTCEDISARCEKISEIFGDKFVTMFLMFFEALGGALPKFSDVVQ